MGNHVALSLVIENLSMIISDLKHLKEKIKPVFEQKGWDIFEVNVNLFEISRPNIGNIEPYYYVIVYGNAHGVTDSVVYECVKSIVKDYEGRCFVKSEAVPYPANSFLGLEFLNDLRNALRS